MSCWQCADWAQFFECAYDYLAEPIDILLPRGGWLLVCVLMGAAVGWLLGHLAYWISTHYNCVVSFTD
jgi:hypothetical protein